MSDFPMWLVIVLGIIAACVALATCLFGSWLLQRRREKRWWRARLGHFDGENVDDRRRP